MIAQLNYEPQRDAAMDVIVSLKKTLDKYKEKSDANQKYIARREDDLVTLARFIKTSESFYLQLIDEAKTAYERGFSNGAKSVEKDKHEPSRLEKEARREYLISRAKSKWADHF